MCNHRVEFLWWEELGMVIGEEGVGKEKYKIGGVVPMVHLTFHSIVRFGRR